jgi:hypothetical protein
MENRSVRRIAARIALTLVAMVTFGGVALHASPASAACASIVPGGALWYGDWSVTMRQTSTCSERWTRLTIDVSCGSCPGTSVRHYRQLWTPYGYYTTHSPVRTVGGGAVGYWETARTPNTSSDRHKSCWRVAGWNGSTWVPSGPEYCTAWVY